MQALIEYRQHQYENDTLNFKTLSDPFASFKSQLKEEDFDERPKSLIIKPAIDVSPKFRKFKPENVVKDAEKTTVSTHL